MIATTSDTHPHSHPRLCKPLPSTIHYGKIMVTRPRFPVPNEAPAAASLVHYYLLWEMVTQPRFPILNEPHPRRWGTANDDPREDYVDKYNAAARYWECASYNAAGEYWECDVDRAAGTRQVTHLQTENGVGLSLVHPLLHTKFGSKYTKGCPLPLKGLACRVPHSAGGDARPARGRSSRTRTSSPSRRKARRRASTAGRAPPSGRRRAGSATTRCGRKVPYYTAPRTTPHTMLH